LFFSFFYPLFNFNNLYFEKKIFYLSIRIFNLISDDLPIKQAPNTTIRAMKQKTEISNADIASADRPSKAFRPE